MPRRCVRSMLFVWVWFTILGATVLSSPPAAQARTIYWDNFENPDGWDVEIAAYEGPDIVSWTLVDTHGYTFFFSHLSDHAGLHDNTIDNTIFSNIIPLPQFSNFELSFFTQTHLRDADFIDDAVFSYGVESAETGENIFAADLDDKGDFAGRVKLDLDDDLEESEGIRLWWRLAAASSKTSAAASYYLHDVCMTTECEQEFELSNHGDTQDGLYEIPTDTRFIITCFDPGDTERYVNGLRYRIYSQHDRPFYHHVAFRTDGVGKTPATRNPDWEGVRQRRLPESDIERTVDLNCSWVFADPIDTNSTVCVGIEFDGLGVSTKPVAPYENVGTGNSRTYINRSGSNAWTSLDDKEFLFSAITDADCGILPTTTTTTTSLPSTTTTTTAVSTTTVSTTTTSTVEATSTSSTTTTTATTPSTTTTVPADDDSDDGDSLDDVDTVDSDDDDDDDSSGCGS